MKTFDELVEEVYNNASFRGEFEALAKLRATLESVIKRTPSPPQPAHKRETTKFVSYHELRETVVNQTLLMVSIEPPEMQTCRRGLTVLFSSICRALSTQYHLDAEEAQKLVWSRNIPVSIIRWHGRCSTCPGST